MEALPKEVRAARAFLYAHGMTADKVPPRRFAGAAKELGVKFSELLKLLALVKEGQQGDASSQRQRYLDREELAVQERSMKP